MFARDEAKKLINLISIQMEQPRPNYVQPKVVLVESKNKDKYRLCKGLNPFKTLEQNYISR